VEKMTKKVKANIFPFFVKFENLRDLPLKSSTNIYGIHQFCPFFDTFQRPENLPET
jgi:hypothetical protein